MSNDKIIRQGDILDPEETSITIPVKECELGSFISSLLGQPQSIEREIRKAFDIDHAWLINLHEVINQRVHQQATAHLYSFRAVVYFKNGMKRTLTSVEAFQTYKEMQQQRSIGIQLEWSYLIKFPNSRIPEKQVISFHAKAESMAKTANTKSPSNPLRRQLLEDENVINIINYRIDYTERTWGNDLENLINDTIETATRQDIRGLRYSLMQLGLIILLIACSIFVSDRIYGYMNYRWTTEIEQQLSVLKNHSAASLEDIRVELISLGQLILTGTKSSRPDYGIYIGGALIGLILSLISIILTSYTHHSFVVLSIKAETWRSKIKKKERRSFLSMFWGYLTAIISSVIAAFLYAYLT